MIKTVLEHLLTDDLAFSRAVESQELVVECGGSIYVTYQALFDLVGGIPDYVNKLRQSLKFFTNGYSRIKLTADKTKRWWRLDLDALDRGFSGRLWPILESSRGISRAKYLKQTSWTEASW